MHAPSPIAPEARASLAADYGAVRAVSERLCAPLAVEDHVIQSMPDVSPPKWHLAHATWFFETFILARGNAAFPDGHRPLHPAYHYLWNSYYESEGDRWERPRRGLLSRPTVDEVRRYRRHVDEAVLAFLDRAPDDVLAALAPVLRLGLHHEQQHQELLVTDIKHILGTNPLRPPYREVAAGPAHAVPPLDFIHHQGGLVEIGTGDGLHGAGFAFDNESPRHRVFLAPFAIAARPVTNGEFIEFIEAGGYAKPEHWLSAGWDAVRENRWQAPLYWQRERDGWAHYTLAGMRPVDPGEPVCHVSHFEADAFARWKGCRLPTEAEWEFSFPELPATTGRFLDDEALHPGPTSRARSYGDVWEWTGSAYLPYPGFRPLEGGLGEYNGKFMSGQMVLRGGSCATPRSHIRPTYRNFFHPDKRWQCTGFRLARSLHPGD